MKKVSVSITEEHAARLDDRQDEPGIGSRSEALRQILDEYDELHTEYEQMRTECDELRTRLDATREQMADLEEDLAAVREERDALQEQVDRINDLEAEVDRLRNEKQTILAQREENHELVRYVEDERTSAQRWRQASIVTRAKWKLLGMPESEA